MGFSLQHLSERFIILRRSESGMIKKYIVLRVKSRRAYQILIKLEFSRQIFEKFSSIKFRENLSGGNRVVPCEQTDGQTRRS
jgi:hypothetical protein